MMCAEVTDGKIHTLVALAATSQPTCEFAKTAPGASLLWIPVLAIGIASLALLARGRLERPGTRRRTFIQALGAWHRSIVGAEPTGPGST
jgi:hypothetical protein